MRKVNLSITTLGVVLAIVLSSNYVESSTNRVICYMRSWNVYRKDSARYDITSIDPNLCTHLAYAYANIKDDGVVTGDEYADVSLGGYEKLREIRSKNPKVKVVISIRVADDNLSSIIADSTRRTKFIDSILNHLDKYGFDGVDLEWKYPAARDKDNLVKFFEEMKQKFVQESQAKNRNEVYTISMIIPGWKEYAKNGYDFQKLKSVIDWFSILSYDFHTAADGVVKHPAPLDDVGELSVNAAVNFYLEAGIDRSALVVTIPTHGISFTLKSKDNAGFGAPVVGPGEPGADTNLAGIITYFEICKLLQSDTNWKFHKSDSKNFGPYIVKDNQLIAYDDEDMIKLKAEYVIKMNLGGLVFWTLEDDDFSGMCGDKTYPLIQAGRNALIGKIGQTSPTVVIAPTPPNQIESETSSQGPGLDLFFNRKNTVEQKNRIVCYLTSWSLKKTGAGRFLPNLIDPDLCTHIIYAYAKIEEDNTLKSYDPDADFKLDGLAKLKRLKSFNPHLRILLAIRDFTENEALMSKIFRSPESRQQLIESVLSYLNNNGFDGVDIIWKNPKSSDKASLVDFIGQLSDSFVAESLITSKEQFLITIALPGKTDNLSGYDIQQLNRYVNWFNVLTHRYSEITSSEANHPSPLYHFPGISNDNDNVNHTITVYIKAGAQPSKLVITLSTSGQTHTLVDKRNINFNSASKGPGQPGRITKLSGSLAYYEICDSIRTSNEWNSYRPYPELVGPIIVKDDQWVAYDDEYMCRNKAEYAADHGLGGLAFWSIDEDDFRGTCEGNPFALISAAKERLEEKLALDTNSLPDRTVVMHKKVIFPEANPVIEENSNSRIVCYIPNWSFYRTGSARFVANERNLNPRLCTHLIYSFAKVDNFSVVPGDLFVDINNGGYKGFTDLKRLNENLKTLISISDFQEMDTKSKFSQVTRDSQSRKRWIENVIRFIKQYDFDGVDINWAHPGNYKGHYKDKTNFVHLVAELRIAFDKETTTSGRRPYFITIAVPFDSPTIEQGYDVQNLNRYINWFNLLTYDYHNSRQPKINHHAPLYTYPGIVSEDLTVNSTVTKYLNLEADRRKLVIGIPTYGRSFTLADASKTDFGSPAAGVGKPGPYTKLNDSLAYYEIWRFISYDGWTVVQNHPGIVGPYAHYEKNWVAFDDDDMVRAKANYVAVMGLGGISFWSVDQDDFRGEFTGQPNVLIEAAKEALFEKLHIENIRTRRSHKKREQHGSFIV